MKTHFHLLTALLLSACVNDGNDATSSGGTSDEDEAVEGRRWCVSATGARGRDNAFPHPDVYLLQTNTGEPYRDCKCYCLEQSQIMGLGAAGAMLSMADQAWYTAERNSLRSGAASACWANAGGVTFPAGYVSCDAAVSDETPYAAGDCPKDPDVCSIDIPYNGVGPTPGGGAGLYGASSWSAVRSCSGNNCSFDVDFFEDVLGDLRVFEDDNIGVAISNSALSHRGFKFTTLGASSLPVAFGFQTNDIIWQVNGTNVNSMQALTAAFVTFDQTYSFQIKVDRGSNTITRNFTGTQMGTYP